MGHISKRFKEISGKADSQKTYPLLEALEIIKKLLQQNLMNQLI